MALKIGIITLPIAENYGGILQAIALYRLLDTMGHDVVLIYKQKKQIAWKNLVIELLSMIPFHNFKNIKVKNKAIKERVEKIAFHQPFIKNEIFSISKDLYTKKELEKFVKDENIDAVIVGSDQVWRMQYIKGEYYKSYFLDFVDGNTVKKIAYAASFGKDYWEGENDHREIAQLLQDFTAVSVRENTGIDICKNTFNYDNVQHVLDPTMLVGKEFYKNNIIEKYNTSHTNKSGLLTYILDEAINKQEIIEFLKKSMGLKSVYNLKGFNTSYQIFSVPQWVASFANTSFIVTDSFHGMVFSIIFEKEFVVIGNHNRGLDRFVSLLSLFGLEDRLVFEIKDLKGKELKKIDYNVINKILEYQKKKSLDFLIGALENEYK